MIDLLVFEDILATDELLVRPDIPDDAMAFLREMIDRVDLALEFRNTDISDRFSPGPEVLTGTVALCSRETMRDIVMAGDDCLGLHLIYMPDGIMIDSHDGPYLHRNICLVVYDREELVARLAQDLDGLCDWEQDLALFTEAWLVTFFHEIAHMRLFQENACGIVPADIDVMSGSGEINNDLFDMSTGYGIRPLRIDGEDVWANSAAEASGMMEAHVEERGRAEAIRVLQSDLAPSAFLQAAGIDPADVLARGREPAATIVAGP
jgi:hypothetical protein